MIAKDTKQHWGFVTFECFVSFVVNRFCIVHHFAF